MRTKLVVFRAFLLARMSPCFVIWRATLVSLARRLQFSPWIKKKLLIESIGPSCSAPSNAWVSAPLSLDESVSCTPMSVAVFCLMVIECQYSFLLGVFGRAVRSPRYCKFSLWGFSLSTSGVIPIFLVYYYPAFCLLSQLSFSMLMKRLLS